MDLLLEITLMYLCLCCFFFQNFCISDTKYKRINQYSIEYFTNIHQKELKINTTISYLLLQKKVFYF